MVEKKHNNTKKIVNLMRMSRIYFRAFISPDIVLSKCRGMNVRFFV